MKRLRRVAAAVNLYAVYCEYKFMLEMSGYIYRGTEKILVKCSWLV